VDECEQFQQVEAADLAISQPLTGDRRVQQDMGRFRQSADGFDPSSFARLALSSLNQPDARMGCMQDWKRQRSARHALGANKNNGQVWNIEKESSLRTTK
jgi:hypothetical protein